MRRSCLLKCGAPPEPPGAEPQGAMVHPAVRELFNAARLFAWRCAEQTEVLYGIIRDGDAEALAREYALLRALLGRDHHAPLRPVHEALTATRTDDFAGGWGGIPCSNVHRAAVHGAFTMMFMIHTGLKLSHEEERAYLWPADDAVAATRRAG